MNTANDLAGMAEKVRVQLDFSAEAIRQLDELRNMIHASSRAETIRHALTVLKWVVNEETKGHQIFSEFEGSDKYIQPVFPFNVKPASATLVKRES